MRADAFATLLECWCSPLPVPNSGSEKFEVTRGVPGTAWEVGKREGLGGGTGGKHLGLVQRDVETNGGEAVDQVAEERADGRRVTSQDAIVEEKKGERSTESEKADRAKLRALRMTGWNGQGEEGGTASSAVDDTVPNDETGGRLVAEVNPRSDTDSVQDGRAVYAVEGILDVDEHHDFVRIAAVPVHPLPCCVCDAFRSMRGSDANLKGFANILDPASHHLKSNLRGEPRVSPTAIGRRAPEVFLRAMSDAPQTQGTTGGGT